MPEKVCKNCEHSISGVVLPSGTLRCTRFPPSHREDGRYVFPVVHEEMHCGEWKAGETTPSVNPNDTMHSALARAMGCKPEEISGLVQQHAPWNGLSHCNADHTEREHVVKFLRSYIDQTSDVGLSIILKSIVDSIEREQHIPTKWKKNHGN